ncbi:acyl-CoA dehydrogenase family protein [Sphingomonas sp. ID0503]|uniref:acyl-CoA dehydrogenase family protein n=1 Tax=Sphingomonas sp. ID0503 TaxID=3399691 RepID=UPI003AFA7A78
MSEMIDTEELREAIRGVLADRAGDSIEIPEEEGRGLDRALWEEMAGLGWLSLAIPEAHGGLGLGLTHLGVLYEELGRQLASVPALPTMLAAAAIAEHGDETMKARWLPRIAAGDCLAAVALPGEAGLPVLGPGNRIDGAVDHLAFAGVATLLLIPVRSAAGTALALIEPAADGVSVTPRPVVDLTRSVGHVTLSGVAVEAGALLHLDAQAWDALVNHAAMGLAVDAVGGAAALLDRTVEYLTVREQFGRPIGSFQALKHRAADWKVKIEAMTALARHAAALGEAGAEDASATASAAKAYACDTYAAFCGDAIQLHGGIGFTWEHPCHLFLKRAKLSQQLFGSSTVHKERAARFAFERQSAEGDRPAPMLEWA